MTAGWGFSVFRMLDSVTCYSFELSHSVRFAELRQQTQACLRDSYDNSPERSLQPRAPALHHRHSSSPETPTDLSVTSVSFEAARACSLRAAARCPPLATSVEHSVCSSHASGSQVQGGGDVACEMVASAADPAGMLAVADGPCSAHVIGAHSQQSDNPQVPATSIRHRNSGEVSEGGKFPSVQLSWDDSRADSKWDTSMAHFVDSWHVRSAVVDKDRGSTVPSAIQGLLRPVGARTQDWKISSARPGLEQYADLRCRLWRPPDTEQILAAAADFGKASDVSGYCSEDSKYMSSSCADPPEHLPLALDRRCVLDIPV